MLKQILNSSIFNSWFSNLVILFNSILAIPIVITKLNVEAINVWFLFFTIVSLSQGILFGFNGTFSRFLAYSYAGVKISEFRDLKNKKESNYAHTVDKYEFGRIFFLMKKIYIVLSLFYMIVIFLIGYFALQKPINALQNHEIGWIAGLIVVVSTTLTLSFGYYQVFLEGINKVALVQRIIGITNLIGLFLILAVLFLYPTLISIVIAYQIVAVGTIVVITVFAREELKKLQITKKNHFFDKELFAIVWESAWKSGVTTIMANVTKQISAILVAQFFSPALSASFLFTKRMFDILERLTMATFQARIPMIARYRSRGDFGTLMPYLRQTQYISYIIFLFGYIVLISFGDQVISMIKSNVELGSVTLIILFSFATLSTRWAGMTLAMSNQANHVVEHINVSIITGVFFAIVILMYRVLGINVFPFAQFMGVLVSAPFLAQLVYKAYHTSFKEYEKKVFIPMFIILSYINFIYFWSNI